MALGIMTEHECKLEELFLESHMSASIEIRTSSGIIPAMGTRPVLNHFCAVISQSNDFRSSSPKPEPTNSIFSLFLWLMFETRVYPFGLNKPLLFLDDWLGEDSFKKEIF